MQSAAKPRLSYRKKPFFTTHSRAFSLIELLVVLAIVGVLGTFSVQALRSLQASQSITRTADTLIGSLEFARSQAVTHNTYVRLLLSVDPSPENPKIFLASLASTDGSSLAPTDWENPEKSNLLGKPAWLKGVSIDSKIGAPGDADITEGSIQQTKRQIGGSFYTFQYTIEFNPAGEARITDNSDRFIKIGLRPSLSNGQNNNLIIRLQGLTGKTEVLRQNPT